MKLGSHNSEGFCACGISKSYTVPVNIEAFQIVSRPLLVQYDLDVGDENSKIRLPVWSLS
jgi:hypothetical protein